MTNLFGRCGVRIFLRQWAIASSVLEFFVRKWFQEKFASPNFDGFWRGFGLLLGDSWPIFGHFMSICEPSTN